RTACSRLEPRAPTALEGARAALRAGAASALPAVWPRSGDRRGPRVEDAFGAIYRANDRKEAERRLASFPEGVEPATPPSFDGFATGIRQWRDDSTGERD